MRESVLSNCYLAKQGCFGRFSGVSTVAEIEIAVRDLPDEEFEQVALTVLERLRKTGGLPPLRKFTEKQIRAWIEEDEKDMAAFVAGQ